MEAPALNDDLSICTSRPDMTFSLRLGEYHVETILTTESLADPSAPVLARCCAGHQIHSLGAVSADVSPHPQLDPVGDVAAFSKSANQPGVTTLMMIMIRGEYDPSISTLS